MAGRRRGVCEPGKDAGNTGGNPLLCKLILSYILKEGVCVGMDVL